MSGSDNLGLNEYHPYWCAFCGEPNEVLVDGSGARQQRFTEDCEVCCRPNLITITIERNGDITIDVEQEYEA
jgi:hypothetical protein